MEEKKLAVIALGGNAILRGNQKGTVEEQNQNIRETLENLIYLVREGYNLIITHGNGPQVGNILMSDDAGVKMYGLPPMTLDMCVAYSQGEIGYMIERNLRNILREHGLTRHVVSMISQVVVDEHDPALQNPTKRVGRIYTREEADKLAAEHGWIFKEEIKVEGGWRRVVPSPAPIDFKNAALVERMARSGSIVITGGGGGIPVLFTVQHRTEFGTAGVKLVHPLHRIAGRRLFPFHGLLATGHAVKGQYAARFRQQVVVVIFDCFPITSALLVHLSQAKIHDTVRILIPERVHISTGRTRCIVDQTVTLCHPESDISTQVSLGRRSLRIYFPVNGRRFKIFADTLLLFRIAQLR